VPGANELLGMAERQRAKQALSIEDPNYHKSWIDSQHAGFNPPTT
jgi:homogentisate 1,2-dioxygenase